MTIVEPELGDTWLSRDPRDGRKSVKVVGLTPSHVLIRSTSVIRVRRDRMNASYRFESRGVLGVGEAVAAVNTGGNPYGVRTGQTWRSNSKHQPRDITVIEVVLDDGYALVRSNTGTKTTRVRLDRFCQGSTGYTFVPDEELVRG